MEREEFLQVYRHSLAHILAKAVIELYGPETQYAIGPQIDTGFYYDFKLPASITEDDFPKIEAKMKEILKRKEDFIREEVTRDQALEIFRDQKYKTEIIKDLPEDAVITVYKTGDDFTDLCRGPHVDNAKELMSAAFAIRSTSGAYWRGDEKNDTLQRIYVDAFPSKEELKEHQRLLREAKERDHKKLGPAGSSSMPCSITGEAYMSAITTWRSRPRSSTIRSSGRPPVTGDTIRRICLSSRGRRRMSRIITRPSP